MSFKRDAKGQFLKGCKAGPGRPKKKAKKSSCYETWTLQTLRDAWFTFRVISWYIAKDYVWCRVCKNDDPDRFIYRLDKRFSRIRYKCLKCDTWNDFREKRIWYIQEPQENIDKLPVDLQRLARARYKLGAKSSFIREFDEEDINAVLDEDDSDKSEFHEVETY